MSGLIVYGADWCPDCRRSKRLLERLGVPYTYRDVDADGEALRTMQDLNGGRQSIPVVAFPDGHFLVEPSDPELRSHLAAADLLAS